MNNGMLVSISWNSNRWADKATPDDLANSGYEYVQQNQFMCEDLNFGHLVLPKEPNNYWLGYTPSFKSGLPVNDCPIIAFFRSRNYHKGTNEIVGFYGFPRIENYQRMVFNHPSNRLGDYDVSNIKAYPENIVLFDRSIVIGEDIQPAEFLPEGKELGKQGWNHLDLKGICHLLKLAVELNFNDERLKSFMKQLDF